MLFEAVADGKLTEEEIEQLEKLRDEYGLTASDIADVRLQLYLTAYATVAQDQVVTEEEWREMEKIQTFLGIRDTEVVRTKRELLRLHIVHEVKLGNLPVLQIAGLGLGKKERAHWSEPVEWEEKKKRAIGDVIVTNKRLIFRGKKLPFALRLSSILDVAYERDYFVVSLSQKPPVLFYYKRDGYRRILRSILSRLLTQR